MIPQQNRQASKNGKWLGWLAFPPVFIVPVLFVVLFTRGEAAAVELSVPLLVSLIVLYVGLSFAYLTLQKKGQRAAAWPAAILADALLLIFASVLTNTRSAFAWSGVILAILGSIMALAQITPPPVARFAKRPPDHLLPEHIGGPEIKLIVAAIAFPAAFLETNEGGEERVVAANDALAAILGRVSGKLDGVLFSDVIPPALEGRALVFADAEWVAHRTRKGTQTLFMLSPAVKVQKPEPVSGECAIVDAESGLFTPYYMKYKAESDVQSCRRYKRRLAVLLFQLEFAGGSSVSLVPPSDEVKQTAFSAFARMLTVSIRNCDAAYRVAEHEIAVFLPDTSQQGAKTVQSRITDNMRKLAKVEVPELAATRLSDAALNFFGEELVSLDQVMQELYLAKGRSDKP